MIEQRVDIIQQARLRPREIDILWLVGQRKKRSEIARELGITPHTVDHHMHMLRTRLAIATKQSEWTREQLAELARKEL